jgi:prolipoprotein diacylglyceryltransferase
VVKRDDKIPSGVIAGASLVATGIGRTLLEAYFRPDQPQFFGLGISTSLVLSLIFTLVGLFIVLVKLGKINVSFMEAGSTEYTRKTVRRPPTPRKVRRNKA